MLRNVFADVNFLSLFTIVRSLLCIVTYHIISFCHTITITICHCLSFIQPSHSSFLSLDIHIPMMISHYYNQALILHIVRAQPQLTQLLSANCILFVVCFIFSHLFLFFSQSVNAIINNDNSTIIYKTSYHPLLMLWLFACPRSILCQHPILTHSYPSIFPLPIIQSLNPTNCCFALQ
jgi:uncharacterized membrane protein YesL